MKTWKVNLIVLWFGAFLVNAGMTMITPFLSLYLARDLHVQGEHAIGLWAGTIFAANFATSFIFQPFWGKLSDKYGRKIMLLRSGFGMAIVITLMGFATQPWHLLALRLLNGTISGFNPASVSLISGTAPKERMGFAMGTIQSGNVAGTILGPLIGGLMAEYIGFRPIFYITGALMFIGTVLALVFVKENFDREEAAHTPQPSVLQGFLELNKTPQLTALFAVTFLLQFAMLSPMSLLPLYVEKLHGAAANVSFWAGFVSAVTGISNMATSPVLGRVSDKVGAHRILTYCLIGAAATLIPQAFVHTVWQLIVIRFLMGVFMGGLLPSVNALIRFYTPDGMESRAFGFNSSTLALGNMLGSLIGGFLAGFIGIEGLFIISGILLLINTIWVRIKLYEKPKFTLLRHGRG
ncbi:MAG: MFS transporter [Paenibacillus macerans]|uniref:LacY proton/sugar symporter family protein n=1 Tax=Paenibacillus macerans TaxID=44252 RepID=A0A090YHN9_PAEMA|nr:MFS transporter [Paenibacillus macerans]KFM98333.1 lacY proton/sugar symporter family protein [Paenibacillus macerans]MBS5910626.1 MFS transporter [Paenibacillus macerans]MCY7560484.1 MFS transporter [Paenibacillus macerans]MDU7475382.1 MFS transporter [Paenibacillus macerans]MEC0137318.1 MFS transporter [Paenibacillus macerans]